MCGCKKIPLLNLGGGLGWEWVLGQREVVNGEVVRTQNELERVDTGFFDEHAKVTMIIELSVERFGTFKVDAPFAQNLVFPHDLPFEPGLVALRRAAHVYKVRSDLEEL